MAKKAYWQLLLLINVRCISILQSTAALAAVETDKGVRSVAVRGGAN